MGQKEQAGQKGVLRKIRTMGDKKHVRTSLKIEGINVTEEDIEKALKKEEDKTPEQH